MIIKTNVTNLFFILILMCSLSVMAEEQRRYKTAEERREAGVSHELTEWLRFTPLFELESAVINQQPLNSDDYTERERSKSLQLEFTLEPVDDVLAEIVYEYDDEEDKFLLDEALAEIELGDYKLELGKLTLPFGEYFSRFVSGPILEFGETKSRSLIFAYETEGEEGDELELSAFIFKSKFDTDLNEDGIDWGLSVNSKLNDTLSLGVSYLSDLAESDERLLERDDAYEQQVDAVSAYLALELDELELSLEYVQALAKFRELDAGQNRPMAWNLEMGLYTESPVDWAMRLEGSRQLEDAPRFQYGVAASWLASRQVMLTLEVLKGHYKRGVVTDDNDQELDSVLQLAAQLGVSF